MLLTSPSYHTIYNRFLFQIPLRATFLSTLFVLPSALFGIFSAQIYFSPTARVFVFFIIAAVATILRNPAVTAVVFKSNELNKAARSALIREQNREIEMQHAKRKREEFILRRQTPVIFNTEYGGHFH